MSSSKRTLTKRRKIAYVAVALACAFFACGRGGGGDRPVAPLASTTFSANLFDAIREAWNDPTQSGRDRLRRMLRQFLAAYPNDGLAPLARLYLVLSLMEAPVDWNQAEQLLSAISEPPAGTARDLYLIAKARLLRHEGRPEEAYDLLRPLVGKMVDTVARAMLAEEVTRAAIEAHHDYEAIAYLDAWLRGASDEERDAVRGKAQKIVFDLPESVLMNALTAMRTGGGSHGYGTEIQKLLAGRLADLAIAKGDPSLARWLVDQDGGAPAVGGDAGIALGELATSRRGIGNVTGRTIGLLLPTGSAELRDEAADVARGVAWALELPRSDPSAGDGTRLVTRDDTGDPDRVVDGLEELAGEGASIIVTGLDGALADRALDWCDRSHVAVVTLAAPATRKPAAFGFVAGEPPADEVAAMVAVIVAQRGSAVKVAPVVEGDAAKLFTQGYDTHGVPVLLAPVECDVEAAHAGEPRFPVAAWEHGGARAWLIDGSAECARDVFHDVGADAKGGLFVVGLEGAAVQERPAGARLLVASAGIVPAPASPSGDPREADIAALRARLGGRPNFWMALGRDAAALARKALAHQPTDTVTSQAEIARRREAARDALASARVPLWTSDAQGFSSSHVLERAVRVVEPPGK